MANIFDGFLNQIATGDQIKDRQHASRLYVANNYALSPKYSWLYHVYFELNDELSSIRGQDKLIEHGMLAKSVDLPSFNIATKTLNNYNRPSIVQTKVGYNALNINFHDDSSDVVRNLWYDYYTYYYRDADIGYDGPSGGINPVMFARSKYVTGENRETLNRFGYTPRKYGMANDNQYIKAIRIYSLHQKRFSEYTLVNPFISAFAHGSHNSSDNGTLDHVMTVNFETVLYASGYITANTVKGFADLHYDKSASPLTALGGGTNSIMGPGGILSAVDTIIGAGGAGNYGVMRPGGILSAVDTIIGAGVPGTNYGTAAFTLVRAFQKNKNTNLLGLAKTELITAGRDILKGKDPRDRFFVPSTTTTFPGINSTPSSSLVSSGSVLSNGVSVNNDPVSLISGIAIAAVDAVKSAVNLAGAKTNSSNQLTGGSLNQVYSVDKSGQTTTSEPAPSFSFLTAALIKFQNATKAKVTEEQTRAAEETTAATVAANQLPQGTKIAILNSPVFTTGTNTIVTNVTNALAMTPGAGSIVPTSVTVAAAETSKFINNGNPVTLTPTGTVISGATNPAPTIT